MSVARQSAGTASASASSISVSWPSTTQNGNLLLLAVAVNGGGDVNIHVPAGWTAVGSQVDRLTSVTINLYTKANATAASGSVTASFVLRSDDSTATPRYAEIYLAEYAGMAISSVVDQSVSASGSSTTIDTGATPTTTSANDVAFCLAACANAPFAVDFNANTTGYTELQHKYSASSGTDRITSSIYEKAIASSGTQFQFTTTLSGGIVRAWCVLAVTLKTVSTTPATPSVPCAQGLFRAGASTLDRMPPVMNGLTYYPDWRNLEASNTGSLNGTAVTAIDNLITYCTSNGIQLKLRVFVNGNNAPAGAASCPAWLTTLCGTFKHANSQLPNNPETMTKFWVQPFLDKYDRLMQLMSERWDSAACLVDVTISNAMMKYAEPLIRDFNLPANRAELVGGGNGFAGTFIPVPGAGYTDAKAIAAIHAGFDTHAAYWPNTCSSFAYNPYQSITNYSVYDAAENAPLTQTKALMAYQRQVLGPRAVLENNSVRNSYFTYNASGVANGLANTGSYQLMYQAMIAQGPPLFFQTATSSRIGDLSQTMSGIDLVLGGNAVEPPTDYNAQTGADYSVANFTSYNAALIANPTGAGTTSTVTKSASDTGHGADTGTVSVTTVGVTTKTDTDAGSGSDASVIAAPLTLTLNPTGHFPAKRS